MNLISESSMQHSDKDGLEDFADSQHSPSSDYYEDGFIVADFAVYNSSSRVVDGKFGHQSGDQASIGISCAQCKKPFYSTRALKQHASREHSSAARPFVCDRTDCRKAFKTRFGLKRHSMSHSNERPFKCDICGRGFLEKGHLQVHRRIHSGERPYKCRHCDCSFAHKPHAVEHERIHSGERPFECRQCGRAFKRLTHLRNHEKRLHRAGATADAALS
ncbi:hypothetical protein BOX15_Mlig023108g3 [Macrostomum lignano]|uniref:C2H2-type domain-containing protein n=1 Tax=Macrostomum lignano TaxID=282301 RepID=A0A267DF45_9PLAT|nr:hypothetical protein BOX15_Mlig023108g2 [Macrostomum lignano]PAA71502.1 hypothetical protein BOX15_Mlig023108g1 [Macrostomum lignano]PAA92189.1 hypothetical protein BOX15_Mlig023108g3 [Macrostomum lignano]